MDILKMERYGTLDLSEPRVGRCPVCGARVRADFADTIENGRGLLFCGEDCFRAYRDGEERWDV